MCPYSFFPKSLSESLRAIILSLIDPQISIRSLSLSEPYFNSQTPFSPHSSPLSALPLETALQLTPIRSENDNW